MDAANVDDDGADEDLERDGGDEQAENERVEPVRGRSDIEQQLELGDLRQREDGD